MLHIFLSTSEGQKNQEEKNQKKTIFNFDKQVKPYYLTKFGSVKELFGFQELGFPANSLKLVLIETVEYGMLNCLKKY